MDKNSDKEFKLREKALIIGIKYAKADKPTRIKVGKIMSNYKNTGNNIKRKR